MTFKLPDGCIEALGIAALLISGVFLSIGFYIAFLRKCDEKTSIKLPLIGYLCKENIGMAFVSTGIVALGFFVSNVFLAEKINDLNTARNKLLVDAAEELRRSVSTRTQLDEKERAQIDFLIKFIQRIDPKNGHAFYFAGTLSRFERPKKESWSHFFRYIELQRILPESERGGDTGSEICYERARGFCPQRIAFVRHMLANDFYDEGKAAISEAQRKDFYTRAYCQSELLMKIYPGGFSQFTPTSVIRSETSVELKKDSGGDQLSCGT
jgi:hypothetical protein